MTHDQKIGCRPIPVEQGGGKLSGMLAEVFGWSAFKRDVPNRSVFKDKNATRDVLLAFLDKSKLPMALALAESLQASTLGTARMGLFFVCRGSDEGKAGKRVVFSRFAA